MSKNLAFDFTINKENNTIKIKREFDSEVMLVWEAYTKSEIWTNGGTETLESKNEINGLSFLLTFRYLLLNINHHRFNLMFILHR